MAWNWSKSKQQRLVRRKPVLEGQGENSAEVVRLAAKYMRQGQTRQQAYAKARKKLKEQYRKRSPKILRGGGVSPK